MNIRVYGLAILLGKCRCVMSVVVQLMEYKEKESPVCNYKLELAASHKKNMGDFVSRQQPLEGGSQSSQATLSSKRIRTTRATSNQIEALLAALEAQPFLATRRFTGLQGRENFEISWKKVAAELNNIIYGSVKTPNQWLTVWRDLKSRACMKAAKIRKEKVQPIKTPPLTEIEKRIISLIGADYSIGTNCPDSMPEEDVIQCSLEAGVNVNTNDGWMVDVPQSNNEIDVDNTEVLTEPPETAQIVARGSAQVTNAPSFEHQVRPRRNINLNPRRSVAEQHNSARSDFLAIAQSNAESMRMLAAAATQQAEAAKIQAEATLLFGQALNKIVDALLVDKNKNA